MNDAQAFSELYRGESHAVLVFLARRTLDGEIAVDLTAETFAIALRSWRKLRDLEPEQQRAWLFTVAKRRFARYLDRAQVERRLVQKLGVRVPAVHEEDLAAIERQAELPQLRMTLGRELQRLSDDQRAALQLRVVEEQSYPDVARALGISEQTARARVSRGLRALAVALAPHHAAREGSP